MKAREKACDNILEINMNITETYEQLQEDAQLFETRPNPLDDPAQILKVDGDKEIPYKRYLTKAERIEIARQKRLEEERIRRMAEDDSSIRALKDMMGGTLEEKQEAALEEAGEKEDWMETDQNSWTDD